MKIFLETYGCSANFGDSEIMAALLERAGHELVDSETSAGLVILNSCYVKDQTETKMRRRIAALKNKKLIIAGCFPEAARAEVEKIAPAASLIGPRNIQDIVEVVEAKKKIVKLQPITDNRLPITEKPGLPKKRRNPIVNIVEINDGCLCECTFCVTRLARGDLHSYSIGAIVNDVAQSVKDGCKEVWLTSQDTGAYGFDFKRNLAELLEKVCTAPGDFKIRVGMMNPVHAAKILEPLIAAYKNPKVFKFLHLPIQSGSDKILRAMKRGNTVEQFETIVQRFRAEIPELTLCTDLIVGFPGETEQDFQKTLDLIERIKPDKINISRYSARPGTPAAEMEQIIDRDKKERSRELTKLVMKIFLEQNKKWIGWKGKVLIDEKGKEGTWIGRNFAYKQVVVKSSENLLGEEVGVEIKKYTTTYLMGEITT